MSLPPRRKGGAAPLGLKNLGNSCYLNSVLQCLSYTPPLAHFCLASKHSSTCKSSANCAFCILERQITRCFTLPNQLDAPFKLRNSLPLFAEHFRAGRQEDAHEFLRLAIDACHSAAVKVNAQPGVKRSIMSHVFGGELLSQVKCMGCKGESNKEDEIMDISLDIYQIATLKDALARFFQPEVLDGNNKYSCGKCKKLSVAKKQIFMLRAPNVLVIQLKRFEGSGKINRKIEFEEVLVLSKFMYKANQESQPEYSLFGSIVHSGFSPESGHYYAYIKDASGRWYCCNDAFVSLSSSQEILSEKVYILFYLRTNQSLKSSKIGSPCNALKPSNSNGPSKSNSLSNGTKPSVSNGNSVYVGEKHNGPLKPPPMKVNGAFSSKVNGSTMVKNGKMSPSLHIKPFRIINPDMKRVVGNGKSNLEVLQDASAEKTNGDSELLKKHRESPEHSLLDDSNMVDGAQEHVSRASNGQSLNENGASNPEEHCQKHKLLASNGIESDSHSKSKAHEGDGNQLVATMQIDPGSERLSNHMNSNGIVYGKLRKVGGKENDDSQVVAVANGDPIRELPSNNMVNSHDSSSASKRKVCESDRDNREALCCKESRILPTSGASCTKSTNQIEESSEELDSFKEELARHAQLHLHSCDYVHRLGDCMRNKKRVCLQEKVRCLDNIQLRKQLITDAKMNFTSQIPESLKAHLIEQLRSFYERKYDSDT